MDFGALDDFWTLHQRPNNIPGFAELDTPRWRLATKLVPRLHPAFDDRGRQTVVVAPVGRVEVFYHLGETIEREAVLDKYATSMDLHERMGGCKGMLRAIEQGIPLFAPSYRLEEPPPIDGPGDAKTAVEFMSMHLSTIMLTAQCVNGGVQRFVRGDDRRCLWSVRENKMVNDKPVIEPSVLFAGHFDWTDPRGNFNPERDAILVLERDPVTQDPWLTILYRLLIKSGWLPEDIQHLSEQRTEYKEASDRMRAQGATRRFNLQEQLDRIVPVRKPYITLPLAAAIRPAAPQPPAAPPPPPVEKKYGWCTADGCALKHKVVYSAERQCATCKGELKPSKSKDFLGQMYDIEEIRVATGGTRDAWAVKQLKDFKRKPTPAASPAP